MIKFCIISDTHTKHKKLIIPKCDILIHCGDFSSMGREHEIRDFLMWFNQQDAKYKIFIAGNHDLMFENNRQLAKSLIPNGVIYLEDSLVEIMDLKIYGTPVQPEFCDWAFNRTEEKLKQYWEIIPNDIDVLITHGPPFGILDCVEGREEHLGSKSLYDEITNRIKPKLSVFGHIHSGYGIAQTNNLTYVNASNLDEQYNVKYNPVIIHV